MEIEKLIEFAVENSFGKEVKITEIKRKSQSWYFRFVVNTPEKVNKIISPLYKTEFGAVECTWHFTAFNCHLLDTELEQFVEFYEAMQEGREI